MALNRGAVVVLALGSSVLWSIVGAVSRPAHETAPWKLEPIPGRIETQPAMTGIITDRNGAVLARPSRERVNGRSRWVIERPYGSALAGVGLGRTVLLEHGIQGNLSGVMRAGATSLRPYETPTPPIRFLVGDPVLVSPSMPTVRLTIDADLSRAIYGILARRGGKSSAVVLDAASGELLALADFPGPDVMADTRPNSRNSLDALHGTNLAASTMKLISAAYILEKRPGDASNSHDCIGYRCWMRHGRVSGLEDAVVKSCNTWFREESVRWNRPQWLAFLMDSGIQPVDTPGLPLSPILLVGHRQDRMHWPHAIGQQVWVSTIGLAAAYATLTSQDGHRVDPFVVQTEGVRHGTPPVVSRETAKRLREILRANAVRGTGRILNQIYIGRDAGGKTGTGERDGAKSDAVFAATAPWNSPKWIVVVSMKAGEHGTVAGGVAGEVLNAVRAAGAAQRGGR